MKPYEQRVISVIVAPEGESIFSEMATKVSIEDEGAGEFVEVSQAGRIGLGKIMLEPNEWPVLREAIDTMIAKCSDNIPEAK